MADGDQRENRPISRWPLVALAALVISLWALSWYALEHGPLNGWPERGLFGDMFGAVNSLFSGLAFAGVVYTILLQHNEFVHQHEEMRRARAEAARLAHSSELSARLAALSQLIQHYGSLMRAWERNAIREIPDVNAPGGKRIQFIDQQAADQLAFVTAKYEQCLSDLERVYEAMSGIPGLGESRFASAPEGDVS